MVYLKLTHGRTHPDEQLTDWGRDGPCLGPFRWLHFTYLTDLYGEADSGAACQFMIVDALIYYDGLYFGDLTIEAEPDLDQHHRPIAQAFDEAKARR